MHRPLTRTERYSGVAIAFHWTIAALIVFNLAVGLFHDFIPREWRMMSIHKAVGVSVLLLSIARLGWRLGHRPPARLPATRDWEHNAARAMHWALYALIVLLPLSGWAMSSVGRNGNPPSPLTWFFLFDIPYLPVSREMAMIGRQGHGPLGFLMIALLVIHIAAAVRHHWILRDVTLARMAPWVRAPAMPPE